MKIRWGIIGCGKIAVKFAADFKKLDDCVIKAVASRSLEKAEQFKVKNNLQEARAYGSYQELANDPDLDVVYIATPHNLHMENTLMVLEGGKAVLCEKPFAINSEQVSKMIDLAGEKNLFLMEAMWTRFLPVITKVKEKIKANIIGTPCRVTADFSFFAQENLKSRLFDPALAGGALLDVGIYPVFFANFIFGKEPIKVNAVSNFHANGIDLETAILYQYDQGEQALLGCGISFNSSKEARIDGTLGSIVLSDFWMSSSAKIIKDSEIIEKMAAPAGYQFEIAEVNQCLREDEKESGKWPLSSSFALIKSLDKIRKIVGLEYAV